MDSLRCIGHEQSFAVKWKLQFDFNIAIAVHKYAAKDVKKNRAATK